MPDQTPTAHTQVGSNAADPAVAGGTCDAKIRPFPNPTEVGCERTDGPHDEHRGVLRDYAYPGSETVLTWQESDRRTFRGAWRDCDLTSNVLPCILPAGHRGDHAR